MPPARPAKAARITGKVSGRWIKISKPPGATKASAAPIHAASAAGPGAGITWARLLRASGESRDRPGSRKGGLVITRPALSPASPAARLLEGDKRSVSMTLPRSAIPFCSRFSRANPASSGSFSKRPMRRPGLVTAKLRPAAPTPDPASTAKPEKAPGAAAAKSTASVPARWPLTG